MGGLLRPAHKSLGSAGPTCGWKAFRVQACVCFMSHNPLPHRWPKPLVAAEDPEVAVKHTLTSAPLLAALARRQPQPLAQETPPPLTVSSFRSARSAGFLMRLGRRRQRSLRARAEAAGRLTRSTSVFTFWVKRSSVSQVTLNSLQNVGMSGVHL